MSPKDSAGEHVLLARQPLFDRHRRVFGYELLFRARHDAHGTRGQVSADEASATLISESILAFGIDTLTHGRPTFVKISPLVLLADLPHALPAQQIVVELPDDISATAETVDACLRLRRQGYHIAINHRETPDFTALALHADYVKADVSTLQHDALPPATSNRPGAAPLFVASNVASAQDFSRADALGCALFQGDFIGRPVMRSTTEIPGNRLAYLRLFHALQNPDISPRELEDLIKPDASLVFRLLRAVNSSGFAQHSRIDSIRQALMLLGYGTVRQWASLWAMAAFASHAPGELVTMSTLRGRTCEIVANEDPTGRFGDGFLLGMTSLLDAILEMPMADVLSHLPLPEDVDAALRGTDNTSRRLLDCVIAHEHGQWDLCRSLALKAGIDPDAVPNAYGEALRWHGQFQRISAAA